MTVAVVEPLQAWAVPQTLRAHRNTLLQLGQVYKQLNAAFARFAMDTLRASTNALKSGSAADDGTYTAIENQILSLTDQRDTLASQMKTMLDAAAFNGRVIDEQQAKTLIEEGESLMERARELAQE